jgi:transcriptional regulator with XRE-family HTH domain
MQDTRFAARFERAGQAWDVALQIATLCEQAGLSQKDLARRLKTSQQQISRLESLDYEGHSLANLRRVAEALHARVRVKRASSGWRSPSRLTASNALPRSNQSGCGQRCLNMARKKAPELTLTKLRNGCAGRGIQGSARGTQP